MSVLQPWMRLLFLMLIVLSAGACSLMTVNLKGPDSSCDAAIANAVVTGKDGVREPRADIDCSSDEAIRYAAGWRQKFMNAAGEHSMARNMNALIAFPAGAMGVYYGVTNHGSSDRIARLSIGSAAVYGATSYLAPQGKQRAYLEGSLALSCVMDASLASRRPADRIAAMMAQARRVEDARSALEAATSRHSSALSPSSAMLARAAVARDNAINLLSRAYAIRSSNANAGLKVATAVDRIVTQTAILVSNQETNLPSLLAMVGDLKASAGRFGLSALPAPPAKTGSGVSTQSSTGTRAPTAAELAAEAIERATDLLVAETGALLVLVRELEAPTANEDPYGLCQPADFANGFKVSPSDVAQSVTVGETRDFQVTNTHSNAFPTYSVAGKVADAIVVSGPVVKGGQLTFEVKGNKPTGGEPVTFVIADPTGQVKKSYQVTVLPKPEMPAPAKPDPVGKAGAASPPAGFAANFTKDEVEVLQCKLGMDEKLQTGVLAKITYGRLLAFAAAQNLPVGPVLSDSVYDEVLKLPPACAGSP
jgi:hypothetical protein